MKTIILALLMLLVPSISVTDQLQAWYAGYNHQYFSDALPKGIIIEFNLRDPDKMGVTIFGEPDGWIRMNFNPEYIKGTKVLRLTELHEMCHVENFVEDIHELDHGPKWQACMHRLANQGAFEDLW